MAFAISGGFALLVWLTIVILNERYGLLSCDRFPNPLMKWIAYFWLGTLLLALALMVTGSALTPATAKMLEGTPFYALFVIHVVLVVFLFGWWLASGRPPLREFLNIRYERPAEVIAIGTAVGVGGWVVTIVTALLIALLLRGIGAIDAAPEPPAMIGWMANLALWKKALIILSAMT